MDPSATAFLAIDMQRDFLMDEHGQPNELARIIPDFAKLTALMRDCGCTIIHTRESYAPDLSDVTAPQGQPGVCRSARAVRQVPGSWTEGVRFRRSTQAASG